MKSFVCHSFSYSNSFPHIQFTPICQQHFFSSAPKISYAYFSLFLVLHRNARCIPNVICQIKCSLDIMISIIKRQPVLVRPVCVMVIWVRWLIQRCRMDGSRVPITIRVRSATFLVQCHNRADPVTQCSIFHTHTTLMRIWCQAVFNMVSRRDLCSFGKKIVANLNNLVFFAQIQVHQHYIHNN